MDTTEIENILLRLLEPDNEVIQKVSIFKYIFLKYLNCLKIFHFLMYLGY